MILFRVLSCILFINAMYITIVIVMYYFSGLNQYVWAIQKKNGRMVLRYQKRMMYINRQK